MAEEVVEDTPSASTPSSRVKGEGSPDPPTEPNKASSKPLRRACDCCRKRKVKCDGEEPCGPCEKASIRCAYLQPPKKKGPKGLRSARVLQALRQIDDQAVAGPSSPLSPEQQSFGSWGMLANTSLPESMASARPGLYSSLSNSAAEQISFQHILGQSSRQSHSIPRSAFGGDTRQRSYSHSSAPLLESVPGPHQLPAQTFLPYVQLFFQHMFPIMPIVDRNVYLDPSFYVRPRGVPSDTYCFLTAISAATIVQLDASSHLPPLHPSTVTDTLFAEECLRERKTFDYVEQAGTLSIMTSFFLFAFYGNHERHAKAWHYLQESITFAENLNMEEETSYARLDPTEAQWRRRLYWLLFVTERAYAVQRRKRTRLTPGINMPAVLESEDLQVLNGFVSLAQLFSAVNDGFVAAWRGSQRSSLCNEEWLAHMQKNLDTAGLSLEPANETQRLDLALTREWLHVLAWQLGVSHGLIWGKGQGGRGLDYPIELARKVVEIIRGATSQALDSHGIGMEQKLADIAGCLADVLKCTAGDASPTFSNGKQYLNILLQQLSSIRGKVSRYLKPLLAKMEGLLAYDLNEQQVLVPNASSAFVPGGYIAPTGPSMADSVGMLQDMSMSGHLGMPLLPGPSQNWHPRGPNRQSYEESRHTNWPVDLYNVGRRNFE